MPKSKVIWFEVLTPKQAMLFLSIGEKLKKFGIESLYTTRNHDYIHDIFSNYETEPISLGEYGGKTLEGKLIASAKRVVKLAEYIIKLEDKPIATISLSSPDASRVAFGLGIPLILFNDTTHSIPVAKLTLSLARFLITPSCINKEDFIKLGANPSTIYTYEGVDEVEYISGEGYEKYKKLSENEDKKESYLVFRPEESFAAYMKDRDENPYMEILEEAFTHYDGKIVILPRYEKQKETIKQRFEDRALILDKGRYFLDLLSKADAVITGGGTMAREAALLGIPSITYFWRQLEPQSFIEHKGFPSYSVQTLQDTKKIIKKICSNPKQYKIDTSQKLKDLQKPSDKLFHIMKKDDKFKQYFN
ncbi:MAG: DUF354 domain-containing protein [Candidatus Heimdallarchaeota archaeon]